MSPHLELLTAVMPEAIMVIGVLAVLLADAIVVRDSPVRTRKMVLALIAVTVCTLSAGWALALPRDGTLLEGMLVLNRVGAMVKAAILFLSGVTLLIWVDGQPDDHPGEYAALVLLATTGMMLMVSAGDFLLLFIALELSSICLYVLVGLNKREPACTEAAVKYFLVGGAAAAFTLFGISLLYGVTGTTRLDFIGPSLLKLGAASPQMATSPDPLLAVATVMMIAGFAFKIAAVPFHLWAPDVYSGAPTTTTALIASGSKVAGFFVLGRISLSVFWTGGAAALTITGWLTVLSVLVIASIVLGNLAAIVQGNVRRLLAYSAIAHGGYMVIGAMAPSEQAFGAILYYALTYAFASLGAFAIVAFVEQSTGGSALEDFAGLGRRFPLMGFCMLVFVLSLAGIPPLAGFFGKFLVFTEALRSGVPGGSLLGLVALAIAASAVSLYYYLNLLKQVYVADGPLNQRSSNPSLLLLGCVVTLALLVILLGCFPEHLIRALGGGAPRPHP